MLLQNQNNIYIKTIYPNKFFIFLFYKTLEIVSCSLT